ncbi:hypothetical protein E3P92_00343 [Wallemia ichthyophaga]|nr:hypothetical protein E3P92_00343 [Wallemia ichthyophaga]
MTPFVKLLNSGARNEWNKTAGLRFTMKHIFNDPNELLKCAINAQPTLNPSLAVDVAQGVVYDTHSPTPHRRVSVIAGGGSGHEPAHVSLVGTGILQASVSGHIFASPSSTHILHAIQRTPPTHAILLIINQYTGDKLNFNRAAQKARYDGRVVHTVTVGDDVSLSPTAIAKVGRRGLTANPLVCKVAGAAAERGLDVEAVQLISEAVAANVATIGASPQHCHVPGRERAQDESTDNSLYVELGLGIHNEPGAKKVVDNSHSPHTHLIQDMLLRILSSPYTAFGDEDDVILVVNNLGGLSLVELYGVVGVASEVLTRQHAIHPLHTLVGSFMTSLNMPGFSLSLLNVTRADSVCGGVGGVRVVDLLYDPTAVTAWPAMSMGRDTSIEQEERQERVEDGYDVGAEVETKTEQNKTHDKVNLEAQPSTLTPHSRLIAQAVHSACDAVLAAEPDLTHWDTLVGDGDCGTTFSGGASAIKAALAADRLPLTHPAPLFYSLSLLVESSMGGTAGALFALYFGALGNALSGANDVGEANASVDVDWSVHLTSAALTALDELRLFTPAQVGDRTLMDALIPFSSALESGLGIAVAAQHARKGAEETAFMVATLGRAAYCTDYADGSDVNDKDNTHNNKTPNIPDPGAMGVSAIIGGIAGCFN